LNTRESALNRINLVTTETETIAKKEYEKIPLLFEVTPKLIWTSGPDNQILWAVTDEYKIHVCDDQGNLMKKITKSFLMFLIPRGGTLQKLP